MLSPSTLDPADLAAAARAADAAALTAAGTFGAVLRASPEFGALLAAENVLSVDVEANAAIEAFGARQAQLRPEITMRILDEAQRAELERLQKAMLAVPSVATYVAATAAFQAVCCETASVVTAQIGIDFAANCRSGGCCG
jgi:cell fate (sporulation/competence/biofilm development) regulator YlbF (YheA/YmcA/DUF963 family)